ncbi:MAG: hypothetical protein IPN29_10850 [Saprospiraceae bacterium]|nr:hypothetical protein [Saprospiraceae bacterium]
MNTTMGMLLTESISYAPEVKSANFLYSVNAVYYPKQTFNRDSLELIKVMFDETLAALSDNLNCKIVYSHDISIKEPFIRVFRLEDKLSGQAVKGQLHLVEDILITLTAFTKVESSLNDDIDHFISSFQWVE